MQPGVTAILATVWLVVAAGVVGAVTLQPLRLSHDQYSPASPSRHRVEQEQTDWRDHDPVKDQPLDLGIGLRKSKISTKDSSDLSHAAKQDSSVEKPVKDIALPKQAVPLSGWQRWLSGIGGGSKLADEIDYDDIVETLPRKVPPSELDDSFVADDTFQDQGPGSVEIYKLDLSKEKGLLIATTPSARLPARNKSKAPKKTGRENSKTKTTEMKSTTSSNTLHRQSNFFEEQRTETPVNNYFGVGGVPELQVGCEGLEASSHKTKRSISTPGKEEGEEPAAWLDVTPITLDLDDGSYYEDDYETDELLKLKKLEESTTTKMTKPKRGDMDATLHADHPDERPEKLPVRGDLGKSTAVNSSELVSSSFAFGQGALRKLTSDSEMRKRKEVNAKREPVSSDDGANRSSGRRLLWLAEANTEGFAANERKRAKRSTNWGFGEDEGVVSSNELQTVNERRRQHEMRYHQDVRSRKQQQRESAEPDIQRIRQEYDRALEQRRREEEERMRRMQHSGQKSQSAWEKEEERRRDEMRRQQYEEYRRRTDHASTSRADYEDTRRQQMEEERRRQEAARNRTEEMNRRDEEERRRREEEARRQEQYRWQEEAERRRKEEEMRQASKNDPVRNLSEENRRKMEERRREWMEKRRREDEKRREQKRDRNEIPENLMRAGHPNDVGQRDRDQERRMREEQEERLREQKLREYIARNQPINVNQANATRNDEEYRRRVEEQRRRQEEERKLQDYIRRNQPVNVPSKKEQSGNRNWLEERKTIEEARQRGRYPDPGATRRRGPSAPTNIDPRSSLEEARRRQEARRLEEERRLAREREQWYEAEERRKELARRQQQEEQERRLREERRKEEIRREEEARREQSRRYEEDRKRLEAARETAERRRQQETLKQNGWSRGWNAGRARQPEATRSPYYDPRLEEHRRRQDSRPIPSNLVRDEARRAAERERQRQEQARLETERRRQEEESRRQKETYEQWNRQEIIRLQALPVSARIILRPDSSAPSNRPTGILSRIGGSENEIEFAGINPSRQGVQAPQFPAPPTSRPPVQSPGPCIWAVVQCCSHNNNSRLTKCFESMGCPGTNWDPNPCRHPVIEAARREVMKFYAAVEIS